MDLKKKLLTSRIIKLGNELLREVWKLPSHNTVKKKKKKQLISLEWLRSLDGDSMVCSTNIFMLANGCGLLPYKGRKS